MSERFIGEAFRLQASGACTECGRQVQGWVAFNRESRVVGSEGFLICAKGVSCDECLAKSGGTTSVTARPSLLACRLAGRAAASALPTFDALAYGDACDHERSKWVQPPEAEERIAE